MFSSAGSVVKFAISKTRFSVAQKEKRKRRGLSGNSLLTDWVTSYSGKNSGIIGRKAKQKVTLETLDHGSDGLGAMVYGQAWVTERGQ